MEAFKKGQFLLKKNGTLFGQTKKAKPSLEILKIEPGLTPTSFLINGKINLEIESVTVVSRKEAFEFDKLYASLGLTETNNTDINTTHFRDDNKEPKRAYSSIARAKQSLFHMLVTHPGVRFQMYRCAHCQEIHIGKDIKQLQELE